MRRGCGPPGHEWWDRREGQEVWQRFGKRMLAGAIFFFGMVVLGVIAFAAFVVAAVVGAASKAGFFLIPVLGILLAVVVGRLASRNWRPVRELIGAAGSLADGDYRARVTPGGSATMRPVTASFNRMAERLEQADEQRRRLLADVGHELRTPLTVIRGEIEAMLDGVHEVDPEHLAQLLDEVTVMERLLADLRTLSLAESGSLALHPEPTDIEALLDDVVDSYRRSSAESGIELRVDGGGVGEIVVDPVRIREVLANLVVNALRAMPGHGSITLRSRVDGGDAVVEVTDTGSGIAPEEQEVVFERFHKGSTSSGSGLGLTISRDLVEAHGGTIGLSSAPGVGTTVTMRVPIIRADRTDDSSRARRR